MEKTFSKIEIAVIKRTAQNVAQFVNKKEKINSEIEKVKSSREERIAAYVNSAAEKVDKQIASKVEKLQAEIAALQPIIDSFQGPIKSLTGGYTTEELVTREVIHTGKLDAKTGKEILQTRFSLKYPETVIPVGVAPVNSVSEGSEVEEEFVEEETEVASEESNTSEELEDDSFNVPSAQDPFESDVNWD